MKPTAPPPRVPPPATEPALPRRALAVALAELIGELRASGQIPRDERGRRR